METFSDAGAFDGYLCEPEGAARCRLLWMKVTPGFDNLGESMVTLFGMATMQGWAQIMYRSARVRGIDEAPLLESTSANHAVELYFLAFIVIAGFILIKASPRQQF